MYFNPLNPKNFGFYRKVVSLIVINILLKTNCKIQNFVPKTLALAKLAHSEQKRPLQILS